MIGDLAVRILRSEKQKENLAKFFWDMAKVSFALLVVGPFAKPESVGAFGLFFGTGIGIVVALCGYILDGMEVQK